MELSAYQRAASETSEFHLGGPQGVIAPMLGLASEAVPELASARTRIKSRFTATPEPISWFFPPKWGINDKLAARPVVGAGHVGA